MKPVGYLLDSNIDGALVFQKRDPDPFQNMVHSISPLFSAVQVAALAARVAELEAILRRGIDEAGYDQEGWGAAWCDEAEAALSAKETR